jgi:AcrR family transcriptional regulator
MGRKSLKEIRVNEILDAFERCLTKKGLQGTTLDNIAEEAGLARRMIRHYIGNRTDLIDAAVERIIEKFTLSVFNALNQFERTERFNGALDYLFSEAFNELPATKLVAALLAVSLYDEQVCRAVKTLYDSFHLGLDHELKTQTPDAPDRQRLQTAYSIMCLSFGGGWMRNIGFDPSLNAQNKIIAQSLIDQLLLVET